MAGSRIDADDKALKATGKGSDHDIGDGPFRNQGTFSAALGTCLSIHCLMGPANILPEKNRHRRQRTEEQKFALQGFPQIHHVKSSIREANGTVACKGSLRNLGFRSR